MSCLREVQTISQSPHILPMPSLTRLTTGGVLNPLKNTTNTSHNELLHQDPLQPPLEPRQPGTLTWSCHNTPECIKQPRPRPWMKRGRGRGRVGGMLPGRNGRSVEAAQTAREGQAPSGGGDCESDEAEEPEGGVHRGKVAGLMNKREDQPGDRTGDAG